MCPCVHTSTLAHVQEERDREKQRDKGRQAEADRGDHVVMCLGPEHTGDLSNFI